MHVRAANGRFLDPNQQLPSLQLLTPTVSNIVTAITVEDRRLTLGTSDVCIHMPSRASSLVSDLQGMPGNPLRFAIAAITIWLGSYRIEVPASVG